MSHAAVRELLREYADEANTYDVRAKALAVARRRRAARRAAPAALALVLVATLGLVWRLVGPVGTEPSVSDIPTLRLDGFPARVLPEPDAPALPNDRGVGAGALTYFLSSTRSSYLVTADGGHYRLAGDARLSPDRKWLTVAAGGAPGQPVTVHDLTTGAVTTIDGELDPLLVWSPDGRWLAIGPRGENPGSVSIWDTREFSAGSNQGGSNEPVGTLDLSGHDRTRVVSIMPEGDLVLAPLDAGDSVDITIVDQTTGVTQGHLQVDLRPELTPEERAGTFVFHLSFTQDGRILVRTRLPYGYSAEGSVYFPKDVLVIDLASAMVTQRWVLPTPRPATRPHTPAGAPTTACFCESWDVVEVRDDGVLLLRHTPTARLALELFDPLTGQRFLVTDLSALPGN